MARTSVAELVESFERRGQECAYVFRRGYRSVRWSYGEVASTARRFARELERRGVQHGERVMLWGENCAEWVAAFYGCALRGAVAVPMDRASAPEFAAKVAQQVNAKLAVCSRELAGRLPGVAVMVLEDLAEELAAKDADAEGQNAPAAGEGDHPSAGVAGDTGARATQANTSRDDILEIIFTSGTTADPKGVVITHGNVLANLEPLEREIAKYLKYEKYVHPLRFLDLLPLSHVFGQFLGLYVPQAMGATVVFHESLNPTEVMETIKRERVSVCIAVPRMLESLKQKVERDLEQRAELEYFRREFATSDGTHFVRRWWKFRKIHNEFGWKFWAFISGGAALDEETERFWGRLAFAVIQGYGLTETTSLISVNHPFKKEKRSIGKVLPGREMKLAEDGEILVRGENIASRYWQGSELKEVAGEEGWFHTGDLGELDARGNLYFKGRKKSVIVLPSGMNVYPADLEAALRHQPGVKDCAVVAIPVGGNAEPCAVLLMEDGSAEAAVRKANESLAEYQQIRRWLTWPEEDFPRTPTQKPKTALIEQWAREHDHGGVATGGIGELIARMTSRAAAVAGNDARLEEDLNLSSIDRVELMSALEDRYQVDLSEAKFTDAATVADLQRMVHEAGASEGSHRYPRWAQQWPMAWIRPAVYTAVTWPATMLMAKPKVIGRENLRDLKGPVLVACNHVTYIDIGFVMAALPWRLRWKLAPAMQGEMLGLMRNPPKGTPWWRARLDQLDYWLITALFNVFPLPQRSGFLRAFAFAGESADRGYSVVVFPEGRRTENGKLSAFQAGIGMLTNRLNLPVVPMRIDGLWEAAQKKQLLVAPNKITVRVGKPVTYAQGENPNSIAKDLERRVREMGRIDD